MTMAKELAKSYNPSEFEDRIYDFWLTKIKNLIQS
jgi:hypothetical protein